MVLVCHLSLTLSNDISSEATGPFKPIFHLSHSWAGGLKLCFFMKIDPLVWLLWQLRFSIDL